MTKKYKLLSVFLILSFVFSLYFVFLNKNAKCDEEYLLETFESENGWGYQIIKDKKPIIVQFYMPCVEGDQPFPDEQSATEVGKLIVMKLQNNEDPILTIEELTDKVELSLPPFND